jgi:hypothetical protein
MSSGQVNTLQAVEWLKLAYLAFLARCAYEAGMSAEADKTLQEKLAAAQPAEANSNTSHLKLTDLAKSAKVGSPMTRPSESMTADLQLKVREWQRKELRRFRKAQDRKWDTWFKGLSK